MTVAGRVWTITGATERARIEFSPDRRLPLCDRVAVRED
jgi:hypothetical protein